MNKKILIIGFGAIAQRHYANIKKLIPNSEIVVLRKSKKKINKIKTLNNLKDAINFKPEITLICSPAPTHLKYAKIFGNLNSNIFIEKPVSINLKEIRSFLKHVKQKKITILTGYNLRFNNALNFFKSCINKRVLGNILSVHSEVGQYLPSWRKKNYKVAVSSKKKLGGGVINELSHDVDILFYLFREIKFYYGLNYKISDLKIDTEDTAHSILSSNFNGKKFYIFLHMDFYRHDVRRKCTIIGSKATIEWDGVKNKVFLSKKNLDKIITKNLKKNTNDSYFNEMKYFIDSIKKNKRLIKEFEQNYKLIKILNLIKKNKCSV